MARDAHGLQPLGAMDERTIADASRIAAAAVSELLTGGATGAGARALSSPLLAALFAAVCEAPAFMPLVVWKGTPHV